MSSDPGNDGFATRAIHVGQEPDPATGAVSVPVYATSTYAQRAVGEPYGAYDYARGGNPTRAALETCLASLEGARHGLAFASGMAAITTLCSLLAPGDHVVLGDDVYGGTYRLFARVLAPLGITFSLADLTDAGATAAALRPETRLVWLETPTNPLLKCADIAALADVAHAHDAALAVDSTFATPYLQRPLLLGADFVVHSTTKYLAGHSDTIGGALCLSDDARHARLAYHRNAVGNVPGPFDCFLTLRGVRTLPVRMRAHGESALEIARFLSSHPAVERVHYPGLPDDPHHAVARKNQASGGAGSPDRAGFGGMVSFVVRGGEAAARRAAESTRLFLLAESLGGVESLIEHPGAMTHASLAGSGVTLDPALLRVSVGLEDVADLIADLDTALREKPVI
ncbi:MAG TPA: cystathionine gamma-synthase [Armatimonadaceae bacterium]|nr:cystathionine gamma-synthase [Armatimonadaceae bacterium]